MRRPSRSFTVEVKRSRLRTGDSPIASSISEQEQLPQPSVASSLSWDELLRRLPENIASQSDQPFITSWPGLEEEQPQPEPQKAVAPAPEKAPEPEAGKPRVLPSLLPVEVPLTERKSAIYAQDIPSWSASHSRLPKQKSRILTTDLQAAAEQNKSRRAFFGHSSKVTVEALKKLVATHLQERTAEPVKALAKPVKATTTEDKKTAAQPAKIIETSPTRDALSRGVVKRRRQDFWKHRLRSYAAK